MIIILREREGIVKPGMSLHFYYKEASNGEERESKLHPEHLFPGILDLGSPSHYNLQHTRFTEKINKNSLGKARKSDAKVMCWGEKQIAARIRNYSGPHHEGEPTLRGRRTT